MNCKECKEKLLEYIEGLLEESQKQAVTEHLANCDTCKAEFNEITNLHEHLVTNGSKVNESNLENNVMDAIVREQNVRLKVSGKEGSNIKFWSLIMKSQMIKIAAAAIIIIAVLIGINPFKPSITIGQVIEPILNARTIIFDIIPGTDETGTVIHHIVVGSRIRRTISNMPNITLVVDFESDKILFLDSEEKTAYYADIQGEFSNTTQNYVKFLWDVINGIKDNPDIEKLDEQIIDGREAVGFRGRGPNIEVTIWADSKTAFPIRINHRIGQKYSILKNFELDVPVDESLLNMDIPPGYTLKDAQMDLGNSTEQDFVESLRVWAEVIGDGIFPDSMGNENTDIALLVQKLDQMNISEEKATQMVYAFGKGMMFRGIINRRGDEWKYVGARVKLGEARKAVFWYEPEDSDTYRVIYGDLHVEDVAQENLPE